MKQFNPEREESSLRSMVYAIPLSVSAKSPFVDRG